MVAAPYKMVCNWPHILGIQVPVPVSGTLLLLFMRPAVVRLGHVCLAHVVRHLVFPSWIVVGRVCH